MGRYLWTTCLVMVFLIRIPTEWNRRTLLARLALYFLLVFSMLLCTRPESLNPIISQDTDFSTLSETYRCPKALLLRYWQIFWVMTDRLEILNEFGSTDRFRLINRSKLQSRARLGTWIHALCPHARFRWAKYSLIFRWCRRPAAANTYADNLPMHDAIDPRWLIGIGTSAWPHSPAGSDHRIISVVDSRPAYHDKTHRGAIWGTTRASVGIEYIAVA